MYNVLQKNFIIYIYPTIDPIQYPAISPFSTLCCWPMFIETQVRSRLTAISTTKPNPAAFRQGENSQALAPWMQLTFLVLHRKWICPDVSLSRVSPVITGVIPSGN